MSPHYTHFPNLNSRAALTKAQKMLHQEDTRYRDLDRLLARAYIELQKQRIKQNRSGIFTPRMDLCDDPSNPFLTATLEVPGMKADKLSVRIENNSLIVEGERTGPQRPGGAVQSSEPSVGAASESESPLYPVRELKYGKFRRQIQIPTGVNATHVRSILVEGMLTISWPRDPSSLGGRPVSDLLSSTSTHATSG